MERNQTLIYVRTVTANASAVLSRDNDSTITNPYDIANTFNNYFAFTAKTTKNSRK